MIQAIREPGIEEADVASFVQTMTGKNIQFSVNHETFTLQFSLEGASFTMPFPAVRKNYSFRNFESKGHIVITKGGTKRFIRPVLRSKKAHPFIQYEEEVLHMGAPQKSYQTILLGVTDSFYLCNFWMYCAELLVQCILEGSATGRSIFSSFRKKINEFINKQELIQNEWGPLVMGQEIKMGAPEISECVSSFTQEAQLALVEAFQLRAFRAGYSLAATNKSEPGRVLTLRTMDSPCHRTLLSRMLLVSSAQRLCRAPREQRGIREAKSFTKPEKPFVYSEGLELPDILAQYITELPTVLMDTPHTVPGEDSEGTWVPTCAMNKDRVLTTPYGRVKLTTKSNVTRTMGEEVYVQSKAVLEKKPDYKVISDDFIEDGNGLVRNLSVSFTDSENIVSHCKVICPSGLKGVTEPIRSRMFASHIPDMEMNMLDSDSAPLDEMVASGKLQEIAMVVSSSGVHSKRSDAIVPSMILSRLAREENIPRSIPHMSPTAWISPERSAVVDGGGIVTEEYGDYIGEIQKELKSKGQNPDGTMYIYILQGDTLKPILDPDGNHFQAIFGYLPWWRTRHRDTIGSDVRTFGPNDVNHTRRGIRVDSHVSRLSGVVWPLNPMAKETLSLLAEGMFMAGTLAGFPEDKSTESFEGEYEFEEYYE